MGDVLNLRRGRKDAERRAKEEKAAANRVSHGLPKAVRARAQAQTTLDGRKLDGHRRNADGPSPHEP